MGPRRRVAALLRRWADKLDPPAEIVPVTRSFGGSRVFVDGEPVFAGSVTAAARTFLQLKKHSPGSRIEWLHDGVRQDVWPQ